MQAPPAVPTPSQGAAGLALVFILLTYGGWNEAAYLSGEIRDARRNVLRVLLAGTGVVTALYLLINVALVSSIGNLRTILRSGDPENLILSTIHELKPSLVIMGTHGRRGLKRLLLGSIAEHVLVRSPVPVMTIRAGIAH